MSSRKIAALRALVDRPGTAAEGAVARQMLERMEAKTPCHLRPAPQHSIHATPEEIRRRFPRGARVFYNCWAYIANDPGRVTGYSRDPRWVRVKFDNLKTIRSIPAYSNLGWHLSTEPLSADDGYYLCGNDLKERASEDVRCKLSMTEEQFNEALNRFSNRFRDAGSRSVEAK